jgi:SulP family sulfate permease
VNRSDVRDKIAKLFDPRTLKRDATAGLVLGVESVPDGLASGLLAGVNPLAGLYGYLYGMLGGALVTSSSFMVVQSTGAMAIIVADAGLDKYDDPEGALFLLAILTGVVMIAAGALKLGVVLRFVSNAVMVGFITAVGINIMLGQVSTLTAYESDASNRVSRFLDTLVNFSEIHFASLTVGVITIVLILWLQRTRLGGLGMVVAILVGSALAALLNYVGIPVETLGDIAQVPSALPFPHLPPLDGVAELMISAIALAFVGLVQGAGVSAGIPNPDGQSSDANRDFIGQGTGNLLAGLFRGMPVGGSMSASSLVYSAGARTRMALVMAGGVMALVILLLADVVELVAMPALAGLLITVGAMTIKPAQVKSVLQTGPIQAVVMVSTLVLTLFIPLQYAVLVGVVLSVVLYVVRQSNQISARRLVVNEEGRVRETELPGIIPAHEIIGIQPHGSLFFAAGSAFEEQLPLVTDESQGSVVILRLRGKEDVGSTLIDVMVRYARSLRDAGSRFVLVTDSDTISVQLDRTGAEDVIGPGNIYRGTEWVGETFHKAYADAETWVAEHQEPPEPSEPPPGATP